MTETLGFCRETRPEGCGFVLFGATGDLAGRKIIPALYGLCRKRLAPENFYVVLAGRSAVERGALEARLRDSVEADGFSPDPEAFAAFLSRTEYARADPADPASYAALAARLAALDAAHGVKRRRLFHLATPPDAFEPTAAALRASGLLFDPKDCSCWSRIIVEKPYGASLAGAASLDSGLRSAAAEGQIYRIDHFTAKETVQNVLALRSANAVFDGTWNRDFIDHVQITAFEETGIEGRAAFFERMGLARDMMSHLLQLAAIVAMDLPGSFRDTDFKSAKERFFACLRPMDALEVPELAVRGQYEGYRSEHGVARGSSAETFLAFKFTPGNERWRGVPFYVRAGKRAGRKLTRVDMVYRRPERGAFAGMDLGFPNVFSFGIQPGERVNFTMITKHPGPKLCFARRDMGLDYRPDGGAADYPTDYERLLIDAMSGDRTLFLGPAEMRTMWEFLEPLLRCWRETPEACPLLPYAAGSPGPEAAAGLLRRDGREWL